MATTPRTASEGHAELPTQAQPDARMDPRSTTAIGREFNALIGDGHVIKPAGAARRAPEHLLRRGYTPRFRIDLFGVRFYLTALRREDQFRFFVAYLRPVSAPRRGPRPLFPRIIYKDSSLVWRTASHLVVADDERWIGKGAVKPVASDPGLFASAEETTNLPFELQAALDAASRAGGSARPDRRALDLVLRTAPPGRIEPYADFSGRRRGLDRVVNGGREVAFFRRDDPATLVFAPGFAPNFDAGPVGHSTSFSTLYGGGIHKHRFASLNGQVQYVVVSGPRHVWLLPPQTQTTALSDYGLRPVDVPCDERVALPGYEFHYPGHSQIPEGFAGAASEVDPSRASTMPWNDRMPVVRQFRRMFSDR